MTTSLLLLSFWSSRSFASRALLSNVDPCIISITLLLCCCTHTNPQELQSLQRIQTPQEQEGDKHQRNEIPAHQKIDTTLAGLPAPAGCPPCPAAYRQNDGLLDPPPAAASPAAAPPCRSLRRLAHSTPGSIPAMMAIHHRRAHEQGRLCPLTTSRAGNTTNIQ
jgi:hypothetical protein